MSSLPVYRPKDPAPISNPRPPREGNGMIVGGPPQVGLEELVEQACERQDQERLQDMRLRPQVMRQEARQEKERAASWQRSMRRQAEQRDAEECSGLIGKELLQQQRDHDQRIQKLQAQQTHDGDEEWWWLQRQKQERKLKRQREDENIRAERLQAMRKEDLLLQQREDQQRGNEVRVPNSSVSVTTESHWRFDSAQQIYEYVVEGRVNQSLAVPPKNRWVYSKNGWPPEHNKKWMWWNGGNANYQ